MKYFKLLVLSVLCLLTGINLLYAQNTSQGVLSGDFSVSATKKVRFSQGNLQYRASDGIWRFAENQYDFIADGNNNASRTYSGWIDLFGYATSGWRAQGQTYRNYQPWCYTQSGHSSSDSTKAYLRANMTGANDSADWGVYNAINNGGNRKGLWRVLSMDEWKYLLNTRTNAKTLRFKVCIDNDTENKLGLLIFPDGASTPSFLNAAKSPTVSTSSSSRGNHITMNQFNQCVALGAVYLPAAGLSVDYGHDSDDYKWECSRLCDYTGCGSSCGDHDGMYWTSTYEPNPGSSNSRWSAYRLGFWETDSYWGSDRGVVDPSFKYNCSYHKYSVRLVREVYTVNFYDENGTTLLKSETVLHGNYATPPATPTKLSGCKDYVFDGWNGGDVTKPITSNKNFTAKYKEGGDHLFTVKFLDWNGNVVETRTGVKCGDPVTSSTTPTRPCVGNICYTFSHWYKDGDQLKQPYSSFQFPDTVVRAEYTSAAIEYYTITWRSDDGTLIYQGSVAYDSMPAAPNPPVKPSTCLTKYTFSHWTPTPVRVSGNATYTAVYDTTEIYYTVRWLNWDRTPLDSVTNARCNTKPAYPGAEPTRDPDDYYFYFFTGWAPADSTITGNTDFIAQYRTVDRYYNVSYITNLRSRDNLDDPTVQVRTEKVEYMSTPSPIASDSAAFETCSYHCEFDGWMAMTPSLDTLPGVTINDPVTRSIYYVAQYTSTLRKFNMTWVAKDTTIVNQQYYDSLLLVPSVKDSVIAEDSIHVFTGWTPALNWMPKDYRGRNLVPCGDTTFTASYKAIARYYRVIVFYRDSIYDVMKSDTFSLEFGTTLNFDSLAGNRRYCDFSYRFDGWDPALQTVTDKSVKVFTAQYTQTINYYNVSWKDWDGTVLSNGSYTYQQRVAECKQPTRPATEDSVYFFTGWTPAPELTMPCRDMTYTATYRAKARLYVDTLIVHGDTILDTVPYDSVPTKLDSLAEDTYSCDSTYYFQNWTPAPSPQDTFGVTYVANFLPVVNVWTVTWKDWNGNVIVRNGVHNGDPIVVPADPVHSKDVNNVYFFKGWKPTVERYMDCDDQTYEAQYITKPRNYIDTIVLFDSIVYTPVEYGTTPNLSQYEALQYSKCDSVFTFNHWTPALNVQDTVAVKYVAVYDTTVNLHSVTWKDWNNQVLHFDYVASDSVIPKYENPGSYKNGQKVYFFKEWTPAPVATMPCNDLVYTANYYSKDLYIIDTVVRLRDTIYEPVEFGTVPNINKYGVNITECDTIYTFLYWEPTVAAQDTTPVKYVAVYDKQVRSHNVTWYSNGSVVESKNYEFDAEIVAPADPTRKTDASNVYFFTGWDKPFVAGTKMPCKDTTFTAVFRAVPRYYRDTIIRMDGDTLLSDPIEYGTTPDFSKYQHTVYHCDTMYVFREWSPKIVMQDTAAVAYEAVYDKYVRTHNVTWYSNGNVVESKNYEFDATIVAPADPTRQTDVNNVYFFTGWDKPFATGTKMPCTDTTFTAVYRAVPRYYRDTIIRMDGDTLLSDPIEFGTTPDFTKYQNTIYHCDSIYIFREWSPRIVMQDTMPVAYTAVYDPVVRKHNVTWYDYDNTVLESRDYEYDSLVYEASKPSRSKDVNNIYFFKGWNEEFVAGMQMPCNDTSFKATYKTMPRYYTDTLIRKDDTIPVVVEFGTTPDFSQYQNTVHHCDYDYTFKRWEVKGVDGVQKQDTDIIIYVAVYDSVANTYNVTWQDDDLTVLQVDPYQYGDVVTITSLIPKKTDPQGAKVYFFSGWTPDPTDYQTMPCNGLVFTATYSDTTKYFIDTLIRYNDTILIPVAYDSTPNLNKYKNIITLCDKTLELTSWTPSAGQQKDSAVTYIGVYTETPITHTVIWRNYDRTVYHTEKYAYNQTVIPPADPTRPTDANNVYFFSGWDSVPATVMPCRDLEYVAQFRAKDRYYRDTIYRHHGDTTDTIISDPIEYGKKPNLDKYKTNLSDCDSTYTFIGWMPNPADTIQDTFAITFVAQYYVTPTLHNVKFLTWGGQVISTEDYAHNAPVNAPADPDRQLDVNSVYFFNGWTPAVEPTMGCDDVVYTATYITKPRYYVDTLIRHRGDTIDTIYSDPIEYGKNPNLDKYKNKFSDCDNTYTLVRWTPDPATVTQDTTPVKFVALYDTTVNMYNVKFLTWNGLVISTEDYAHNDFVTAPADTVRGADVNSVYFFTGWTPAFEATMGCDDVVYRATYKSMPRYYRDTLIRHYGDSIDTIYSDPIEYGTTPNLDKYYNEYSDCDYTYTLAGWTPDPATTIQDTTPVKFVAVYDTLVNEYNVTFKNWRYQVIATKDYKHGDPVDIKPTPDPVRPADQSKVYFFTGWNPTFEPTMGCADVVYTPNYNSKPRYYNDTLYRQHGDTIDTIVSDPIAYGTNPDLSKYEESIATCDTLYTFDHWTPNPLDTLQDTVPIIFKAVYTKSLVTRTVTWMDWNRYVIDQNYYHHGDTIDIPADPTRRPGVNRVYFFAEWTPAIDTIMGCNEAVYTARYNEKPRYYQDTLIINGDSVVVPQILSEYGVVPDFSDYENNFGDCENDYIFQYWTPAVEVHDTMCMTYTAVYDTVAKSYTVTWQNWNRMPLGYDTLAYGESIVLPANEPTRPKDPSHVYFFDHWDPTPEATMPCRNEVYTAQYTSAPRYYRDTVVIFGNDTVVPQVMVEYGDMPTAVLSQFEDDVFSDCANTYTFRNWIPTPAPQGTAAVTYVADYDTVPNKYVAMFVDYNGDTLQSDSILYNAPVVAPADPTRPMDMRYIYTFKGWSPAVDSLMPCNNTKYTATYTLVAREFVDTVITHNDTILITMHYGERPDLTMYQDSTSDCGQTYLFHHWNPAPAAQDTTSVTYRAIYSTSFNKYVVTWNTWDGDYYTSDTLQYNARIYTPAVAPQRLADSANVYFFDHWSPTPSRLMPCGDVTYTPVYRSSTRFYDIPVHTMEYDTTLRYIEYGENPASQLALHEYDVVHCDSTFYFDHWTPTPSAKDTNAVQYTAVYNGEQNFYNIAWMNGRDTIHRTTATYGALIRTWGVPTPTRPATQDSIYTFSGWAKWTPTSYMGCGDTAFYAKYTSTSAWITDTIVLRDTVVYEVTPYDSTPNLHQYEYNIVKCDYTYYFNHWNPDPETTPQPGYPIAFKAVYDSVRSVYNVTWINGNGDTIQVDPHYCGDIPTIADPTMPSTCQYDYTFSGWSPQVAPVNGNITYRAQYTPTLRNHYITWYNDDLTVLRVDTLHCGDTPSYPCVERLGGDTVNYRFTGWNPAVVSVDTSASYVATFESEERTVTYDSTLSYVLCTGNNLTLPSGKTIQVTADGIVLDTVYAPARHPYFGQECYNNDSLVDITVYVISVANYKNPLDSSDVIISCPGQIVEGMFIDVAQTLVDIKNAFVGAYDELIPDWTTSEWRIIDLNGNWVTYTGFEIRDREVGDTIYLKYVIPTNCGDIEVDLNALGCDMSVHKAHADNCPDCQNDSVVIAVYDWLLMYEHVRMQAQGYNVTPDKVNWFAVGGDDWDNLEEWTIPMALDDEYLGTGYYYTLNQPFNGTGDYYALVDVTGAGDKATLPCLGIMRSQKFHYAVAQAGIPAAQIYPTEVRNSDVVYVVGLQSDVKNDIYVYDMAGKLVSHDTVTDDHYEFRAAGAAGTYRVVVITENNKQTLSFIIL